MSNHLFKINLKHLHPIDVGMYYNAYNISSTLKKYNVTPNNITTLCAFYGILSCYSLYNGYKYTAIFLSIVSYFFDVCDGIYARKYNMVTEFGDYYDHFTDLIQYVVYIGILIKNYNLLNNHKLCIALIIQLILTSIYVGCIEQIYTNKSLNSLSLFRKSCIIDAHKHINKLKYISNVNLLIIIYIITIIIVK